MRNLMASTGVVLCLASNPAAACEIGRFNFAWGSDSGTTMAVKSGESCAFGFRSNIRGVVKTVELVRPPQHGVVSQTDRTHWRYKPAAGFSGHDSVVVKANGEMIGNRHSSSGDTNLTWNIDVSP